jgi:hypothetical protein
VTRPDEMDRKAMSEGMRMQVAHPDHPAVFPADPPDMDARGGENGVPEYPWPQCSRRAWQVSPDPR